MRKLTLPIVRDRVNAKPHIPAFVVVKPTEGAESALLEADLWKQVKAKIRMAKMNSCQPTRTGGLLV